MTEEMRAFVRDTGMDVNARYFKVVATEEHEAEDKASGVLYPVQAGDTIQVFGEDEIYEAFDSIRTPCTVDTATFEEWYEVNGA